MRIKISEDVSREYYETVKDILENKDFIKLRLYTQHNTTNRLLHSLTVPWDLSASPLYRHLATKEAAGEAQSVLLEPLLDQVEADPDCAFLREMPEYGTMVEKYRRAADGA